MKVKMNPSGENKRAHLAMIHEVINRMGGNLFFFKGWAVTLIIALFAVMITSESNSSLKIMLICTILFFWGFDAYFLSLERCYRDLYDAVRVKKEKEIDFSMNIQEYKKTAKNTWIYAFLSKTLLAFYPLLGAIIFISIKYL